MTMVTVDGLPADPFLRGYLLAAFWTHDDDAPSGEYGDTDRPTINFANLSQEALELAARDCAAFEAQNEAALSLALNPSQSHETQRPPRPAITGR